MANVDPRVLYGVVIQDVISRGNIEEMRAFVTVSASLLQSSGDLESAELEKWKSAHEELMAAVAERAPVDLSPDDIIAIKDGIVVIDSIELARALKPIVDSDLEPRITISW